MIERKKKNKILVEGEFKLLIRAMDHLAMQAV